jgi:hypothetical protein
MGGTDKSNIFPYEAVFGIPYHKEIVSTVEDAARCVTVEERLALLVNVLDPHKTVILKSGSRSWRVNSAIFIKQYNTWDCGPIACAKLMDSFGLWDDRSGIGEGGLHK